MSTRIAPGAPPDALTHRGEATRWQEVEWGRYTTDLPLWEELAPPGARVLELGCGLGRVALHLAAREREVVAVEHDARLLADLGRRAAQLATPVRCLLANVTALELGERFDSILAPLQLANVVEPSSRAGLLRCARMHLAPGGSVALSILCDADARELVAAYEALSEPRALAEPDAVEIDGCLYSSHPLAVRLTSGADLAGGAQSGAGLDREPLGELSGGGDTLVATRLRVVTDASGERREEIHEDRFHLFAPEVLEREAAVAGLRLRERRRVAEIAVDAAAITLIFEATSDQDGFHQGVCHE